MKMFYTVYKTTNLINGKIYIGMHSTIDLNDSYIGSGTKLKRAIKKYGKENFKREILFIFDNWIEMVNKEKEIVTEEFIKRKDVYNIVSGGVGLEKNKFNHDETTKQYGKIPVKDINGCTFKVDRNDERYLKGELIHTSTGMVHTEETKQKISNANKGSTRSDEFKEYLKIKNTGIKNPYYGKHHTEETKQKISNANKGRVPIFTDVYRKNLSNSCLGKIWITSPCCTYLSKTTFEYLDDYINLGWYKGTKKYRDYKKGHV